MYSKVYQRAFLDVQEGLGRARYRRERQNKEGGVVGEMKKKC